MNVNSKQAEFLIHQLRVLVVDDNQFMRSVVRGLLTNIGVKKIFEAGDGIGALDMIRTTSPDVVDPRLGDAAAQRPRAGAHRALARRVPDAGPPYHHTQRRTASAGASWNRSSSA